MMLVALFQWLRKGTVSILIATLITTLIISTFPYSPDLSPSPHNIHSSAFSVAGQTGKKSLKSSLTVGNQTIRGQQLICRAQQNQSQGPARSLECRKKLVRVRIH